MPKKPARKAVVKRKPRGKRRKPASAAVAVETALASLAHEIRTPLNSILALSELLTTADLGERERGWAVTLKDAAQHLARYTTVVTDAMRANAVGLTLREETFNARQLAEAVGASLAARAQASGLRSELMIASSLPENVVGDPVRLRAALENLIDNAVKFTAQGTIRLDVRAQPAARRRVRLTFAVTDSGVGLTSAEIKRLFRPFAQASAVVARRYGGAGLGLALVKRLARAMGGDLTLKSRPKRGSTFTFSVTVASAGERAVARLSEPGAVLHAAPARHLNILCVEDNPYGRVVMRAILAELGHRVSFAGTGAAAIPEATRGEYDLVLMDVTLPDLSGVEVTRRIRALRGNAGRVPIIGLSGHSGADEKKAARTAGMNAYLAKPISPAVLAKTLERFVR